MAESEAHLEFRDLMLEYEERHADRSFQPLSTLTQMAEMMERAHDDFYANNPDPLDTRHPVKVLPNCALGYMLKHLHRNTDFFEKVMVSYLMPHESREVNVMSARVLVSCMPIMDSEFFTNDTIKELYTYALHSDSRELRAYSTLLLSASMTPEHAHTYRANITAMIGDSLRRLRQLYQQLVHPEAPPVASSSVESTNNFSGLRQLESGATTSVLTAETPKSVQSRIQKSEDSARNADNRHEVSISTTSSSGRKRAHPKDASDAQVDTPAKRSRSAAELERLVATTLATSASAARVENGGACTPLRDYQNDANSNCSSTVDEMRRIIVGDNRIYPLTIQMEQRMILQYLQSVCEFTDHLSILCDSKALGVIMQYLNTDKYADIRLLFEAVYCLGTMLIHRRLCWDFVYAQGLRRLVSVNRHSLAAAAVCLCLQHLSQFDEVMLYVSQSPHRMLHDIIDYAVWQLGHGYESCRQRVCAFFVYALQFKTMLDRFEQQDGLRVLYNYASSRLDDYLEASLEENYDLLQDKIPEYSTTLRNTCSVLQRYMESHILLKYESIKRHHPNIVSAHGSTNSPSTRTTLKDLHKQPLVLESHIEKKALELLLNVLPTGVTWHPVNALRQLGFLTLLIRTIGAKILAQFNVVFLKTEAMRMCMNVLSFVTVSPHVVKDMCETIQFPEVQVKICGIGILLDLIDSDAIEEAETKKLLLRCLVHCFCGPRPSELVAINGSSERFRSPADALVAHRKSKSMRYAPEDTRHTNTLAKAWECGQNSNAIMTLLAYIRDPLPPSDADALRSLACRALVGLARSEAVRQIVSRLPLMANNELTQLMIEPLLQDKHAEHAEFRRYAFQLLQTVHQTTITSGLHDVTLDKLWKASVIKQTRIRFDDSELLKLIQEHLRSKGLHETATKLEDEARQLPHLSVGAPKSLNEFAQLNTSTCGAKAADAPSLSDTNDTIRSVPSLTTCSNTSLDLTLPEAEVSATASLSMTHSGRPAKSMMSMIKPKRLSETPKRVSVPNRTLVEQKRRSIGHSSLLAQTSMPFSSRHQPHGQSVAPLLMERKPIVSLDEMVTNYFRTQHALCEKPIVTCPPFSFYFQHKCPMRRDFYSTPVNVVERFLMRQSLPHRQTHASLNRFDRNLAFSHYCPSRYIDIEEERITACNFSYNDGYIQLGTYAGELHWVNRESGVTESTITCHNAVIKSIDHAADGELLLTSSVFVRPYSALWRLGESQDMLHEFNEATDMKFGYTSQERMIGTEMFTGYIFDTETGSKLCALRDLNVYNEYSRNRATFNFADQLVLNDGVIWDVRANPSAEPIHKFDKFSHDYSATFHPNGNEVLICGQVWDVRTYGLLRTVNMLENCDYMFNPSGDIIFATKIVEDVDDSYMTRYAPGFRVIDAKDYRAITLVDTKRDILAFSVDHHDRYVCTVEQSRGRDEDATQCRLYEIGRLRDVAETDAEDDEDEDYSDADDFANDFDDENITSPSSSMADEINGALDAAGFDGLAELVNFEDAEGEEEEDDDDDEDFNQSASSAESGSQSGSNSNDEPVLEEYEPE